MSISSFNPSCTTRFLSFLTSPKVITGALGIGATAIAGCTAPACIVVGGTAILAQSLFTRIVSGGSTLRSAVFIGAEHLSRANIQGGLPFVTIPPVLKALDKVNTPKAIAAKNALQGLLEYENCFDYLGLNNYFLLRDFTQKIKELLPGQMVAFPLSYMNIRGSGHIVIGSIECIENGKYTVRIHQGGEGVCFHPKRLEEETGRQLYQTTYEISEVLYENLVIFIKFASKNHAFGFSNNILKLYAIRSLLSGKALPPSQEKRYWMREQEGNSCSGYSIKCYLQFALPEEDFEKFEMHFLMQSVENLRRGLKNGFFWEKTEAHKLVYKELQGKLVRLGKAEKEHSILAKTGYSAKVALKVQQTFWEFFFPITFESAASLRIGIEIDNYSSIGEHHPDFIQLAKLTKRLQVFNDTKLTKMLEKETAMFNKLLDEFYQKMKPYIFNFSKSDRNEFENSFHTLKELTIEKRDNALCQLYRVTFKNYTRRLNDPMAQVLNDVYHSLRTHDFESARSSLEAAYKIYSKPVNELTQEQSEDLGYVFCRMLYLKDAFTFEDMDIRAGMVMLFLKLKFYPKNYLERNLNFYRDFRLDREFPNTPWEKLIIKHFQESKSSQLQKN